PSRMHRGGTTNAVTEGRHRSCYSSGVAVAKRSATACLTSRRTQLRKQLTASRDLRFRHDGRVGAAGRSGKNPEAPQVGPRRRSGRTIVRTFLLVIPLILCLGLLSGCDDAYDISILYIPRSEYGENRIDWLVESLPKLQPTRYDPPGVLPLETLD